MIPKPLQSIRANSSVEVSTTLTAYFKISNFANQVMRNKMKVLKQAITKKCTATPTVIPKPLQSIRTISSVEVSTALTAYFKMSNFENQVMRNKMKVLKQAILKKMHCNAYSDSKTIAIYTSNFKC